MDVANGDLEMKHALVQMGVSAATSGVASGLAGTAYSAASPYASQAVTMAASGIDYEEGGGIGWSGDNFKAGIKRGMVNMAITATGNSFNKGMNGTGYERVGAGLNSGVSSFVNSGLDVDNGSWWRIGWKEEGTMDHVMAGLASATASAATYSKTGQNPSKNTKGETTYDKYNYDGDFSQEGYNSKLLYNTINSGMMSLYNMAAHDLSWEDASKQNGFYSGMLYDHKDVGGRLGKFVASGFDPDFDRKQSVPQDDNNKNPNNEAETLLGGLWQGLKQIGDDATDIGSAVTNGFAGNGLISDREIARVQALSLLEARKEYAGHQNYMAAQSLQLSDIADAVNAANNGGARGDANANMSKLLTALNNKFGLEREDRITSAEDMQAVISSGRVNVNDVMTVALESSNSNATFANVYGVAGGVRSGSLVADDNGFYTKGGQMVAGRYVEPGTADYNKMIAGLYDNKILSDKIMAQQVYEKNNPGFAKRFALAAGSVVNSFLSSTATTAEAKGMDFTLNGKSKIENLNWFDAGSSYSRWGFNMLQNSLESKLQSSRPFFSTNPSNDEIKEFGLEYLKSDGGNIGVTLGQGFADQYKNYFLSSKNIEDWLIYTMGATASYAGYVASNKEISTMTHIPIAKVGDETVKVKASYGWKSGEKINANIQVGDNELDYEYSYDDDSSQENNIVHSEIKISDVKVNYDYNHTEFENGKTGYTAGAGVSWNYNGFYAGFNFTNINTLENLEKLDDGSYTYQPRVGFNTTYTGGYNTTVNNFSLGIDVSYSHTVLENRKNEKDMKWWVTGTYYHNWLK